jgi:AcrR family transcriptional regulator
MPLTDQSRRDRILDAAEHAFAEAGFAGASMRHIVLKARVNLATVYYYFGSKNGLMEAVLKRRFGPLRQEHLEMLRTAQNSNGRRPLSVDRILQAMLWPPLRLAACDSDQRHAVMRLIGRIVNEPGQQIQDILHVQRAEVREAFLKAFQETLPDAARADLLWRLEFVWGALTFILCNPKKIEQDSLGECNPRDTKRVLDEMIRFFSPGFRETGVAISRVRPGIRKARRSRLKRSLTIV